MADLPDMETEIVKRYTFTLITRPANDVMVNIHNDGDKKAGCPVFPKYLSDKWLSEELSAEEYKTILDLKCLLIR
jgi:hypothetical protein